MKGSETAVIQKLAAAAFRRRGRLRSPRPHHARAPGGDGAPGAPGGCRELGSLRATWKEEEKEEDPGKSGGSG